jgi:hypothetical protein
LNETLGKAVRWLTAGKWDPNRTAKDAYIEYLSRQGNLGEDRDNIERIFGSKEVGWDGVVAKVVLSRGDIGKRRDNFERVDASLDLMNFRQELKAWNESLPEKDPELSELEFRLDLRIKECQNLVMGIVMPQLDDNVNLVIDKPYLIDMVGAASNLPAGNDGEAPSRVVRRSG